MLAVYVTAIEIAVVEVAALPVAAAKRCVEQPVYGSLSKARLAAASSVAVGRYA